MSGNDLPSTPDYTTTLGARYRHAMCAATHALYGRGEVVLIGAYEYDDANTAGQDGYSLTNLRAGVQEGPLFGRSVDQERLRHALRPDRLRRIQASRRQASSARPGGRARSASRFGVQF